MWKLDWKSGLARLDCAFNLSAVPADLCLILETSTRHGSAALADENSGVLIDEVLFESDRNHNALMFGPLADMMDAGMAGRITRVIVGAGPGSYSGTRVGIAVAQGVAIARGCPAIALPSLLGVPDPANGALAVGDARRGHWWWAKLRGRVMESDAPELGDADAFRRAVETAMGEGRQIFSFESPEAFDLNVEVFQKFPRASELWRAWHEAGADPRAKWAGQPAQPCYLKPPHITAPKRPWLQG